MKELLDLVSLRGRAETRAGELAYGDQRRLELVRALATRPRLLLLDSRPPEWTAARPRASSS